MNKSYIAIDLKSFYASVECIDRGLDPLTTNLVVADINRTEKTICLAVSPSLKKYQIPGRPRLFQVIQKVKEANILRRQQLKKYNFQGKSFNSIELDNSLNLEIDYIIAPPRMALYLKYSTQIYNIYLKYFSKDDIHVYSIDEVFIDITPYLKTYNQTPRELTITIINHILKTTGITATAGIGTNLYLSKIAMDIVAKKIPPDENNVRVAQLDEHSYRRELWTHKPLTDFWRVGKGYAKKLEQIGLYTMGDIAKCSLGKENQYYNESLLYKLFGINAELLIDHAWGYESCQMSDIKAYKPKVSSINSGQVLTYPYTFTQGTIVISEMAETLALDLTSKNLTTDQIVITVGYDIENLTIASIANTYKGEVTIDPYGRTIPKHSRGTANLGTHTASSRLITTNILELWHKIVNPNLLIRRLNITANHLKHESELTNKQQGEQLNFFTNYEVADKAKQKEKIDLIKEATIQQTLLKIKNKYGKNAILKGSNLTDDSTAIDRNNQIGGHKA